MRRFILVLSMASLALVGHAPPAASQINARAACEGYCAAITAGCYVFLGLFVRESCGNFYEGCTAGCTAALLETSDEEENR